MKEISVGVGKSLNVPAGANSVTVVHEWGDVVDSANVGSTYTFTPDSIGVHKIVWSNGSTEFYQAVVPLISSSDFTDEYPEFAGATDVFAKIERHIRGIVQNYTGQKFGPYVNKTLEIQGDGGDSLALPVRVVALNSVETSYGVDLTDLVRVNPNEPSLLIRSPSFSGSPYYEVKRDLWRTSEVFDSEDIFLVKGVFGWEYVPVEVSDAASILMADVMGSDDVVEMRRRGVFEAQIGDFSFRLNADQWGTTGNTMADNLLAEYVNVGLGLV